MSTVLCLCIKTHQKYGQKYVDIRSAYNWVSLMRGCFSWSKPGSPKLKLEERKHTDYSLDNVIPSTSVLIVWGMPLQITTTTSTMPTCTKAGPGTGLQLGWGIWDFSDDFVFKLHKGSSIGNTDIIDIIEDIGKRDICWLKHEQVIRNRRSEISLFILIVHKP